MKIFLKKNHGLIINELINIKTKYPFEEKQKKTFFFVLKIRTCWSWEEEERNIT